MRDPALTIHACDPIALAGYTARLPHPRGCRFATTQALMAEFPGAVSDLIVSPKTRKALCEDR
jgi:hypothetical protein